MPNWQKILPTRFQRDYDSPLDLVAQLAALRERFNAINARIGGPLKDVAVEPARLGHLAGEWLYPAKAHPERLLLYLHGGYFVTGTIDEFRPLVARLCSAAGAAALLLDYRTGPDCPYPQSLRDAVDAYRFLHSKGFPHRSVVLAGDGSGGGIAFAAAIAIRDAGMPMPAAVVAMSPWADLTFSGWSVLQNADRDTVLSWDMLFMAARFYLKGANPGEVFASPVYGNLKGFPPIMVHAGSLEILRDDAGRLGELAAAADVPVSVEVYDGMNHLFQADASSRQGRISIDRLGAFVRARTREAQLVLDFAASVRRAG